MLVVAIEWLGFQAIQRSRFKARRCKYSIVLCAFGLSVGCSSVPPPIKEPEKCKLQKVTGAVIASEHINPDEMGEARPVQMRLYQTKSDINFQNATFEKIWKDDKSTLGDDFVKVEEFPVYPNTRSNLNLERDPSAQFIVAAALFREPKGKSWFASFELPPPPTAGSCGASCIGDNCDGGVPANPRIYVWIDETRVQDGSEHADEAPAGRTFSAPGNTSQSCDPASLKSIGDATSSPPAIPDVPTLPATPNVAPPTAPKAPKAPKAP